MSLPQVGKCAAEWLCGLFGKVQCFLEGAKFCEWGVQCFFGGRKGKGGYSVIRLFSHPLVMYKSVSEVISPTA